MVTAATLMTLTSLSGLVTLVFLMRINFKTADLPVDDDDEKPVQVNF
jgi:hypothetical protein